MKKNLVKGFIVMALLAGFAAPVLADGTNGSWNEAAATTGVIITDTGGAGLSDLKFSANVWYKYIPVNATGSNGVGFGLQTWNSKGTKVYASNAESSKIYATVADVIDGTARDSVPVVASGTVWSSGAWNEVGK